jgi:cysteinyl-tRNA synthetase
MRLYDSLTRTLQEVDPIEPGHVKMYACGPTVYRYAHLGNLRSFMLYDLIRRALQLEGFEVTEVMNITDVGHMTDESSAEAVDKMQLATEDEALTPDQIAEKYTRAVFEDATALGVWPADRYPKATEHIQEMVDLTATLVDKGHAYVVDNGSVYYDVTSFEGYGKLSGNTLDNLREGHRDLETDPRKRHAADFALWKAAGPRRLMRWPSPWGDGFPGWHIECSAMSMKYLGERFDIHTGGTDLRFPHHEDEIAQSEGAVGHPVVSIWVHAGHLRLSGQKIAKSTGNVVLVRDLRDRGFDPLSFRWLCFQTQYRSEMDFSWDAMAAADQRVKQLRRHMAEWVPAATDLGDAAKAYDARVREALTNDLHMPGVVAIVNELDRDAAVPPGEKYLLFAGGNGQPGWDHVLGLDLERDATSDWQPTAEMRDLMSARDAARVAKDFARSDELREQLIAMGVEVMDTADGTSVRPR